MIRLSLFVILSILGSAGVAQAGCGWGFDDACYEGKHSGGSGSSGGGGGIHLPPPDEFGPAPVKHSEIYDYEHTPIAEQHEEERKAVPFALPLPVYSLTNPPAFHPPVPGAYKLKEFPNNLLGTKHRTLDNNGDLLEGHPLYNSGLCGMLNNGDCVLGPSDINFSASFPIY